jgi:hypothetical protein
MARVTIRASSLPTWEDCQRRASTRAIRAQILDAGFDLQSDDTQGIAAVIGTAVHAGVGTMLEIVMDGGALAQSLEPAVTTALGELDVMLGHRIRFDDLTPSRDIARLQVERLVAAYQRQIAPEVMQIAVEQDLSAVIALDGIEIELTGHVDQIEPARVRDLKTGRSGRAYGSQLGAYALLARSHGYVVEDILEDAVPRTSIRHEIEAETMRYDVAACERQAYAVLRHAARAILDFGDSGAPEAFLANAQSFACSEALCGAYGTSYCRIHKSKMADPYRR